MKRSEMRRKTPLPRPTAPRREDVEKAIDAFAEESYRRYEEGGRFDHAAWSAARAALRSLVGTTADAPAAETEGEALNG